MFKFTNISKSSLKKIQETKEGSTEQRIGKAVNIFGKDGDRSTNLVMPHQTYMVELSTLKAGLEPRPIISGIRVIDAAERGFMEMYDVYDDAAGGNREELQVIKDSRYIKAYESAFSQILGTKEEEVGYEVRNLKIPALHVEALWLHKSAGPESDLYLPFRSMGLFDPDKLYDQQSFFSVLRDAATGYDLTDDRLGG